MAPISEMACASQRWYGLSFRCSSTARGPVCCTPALQMLNDATWSLEHPGCTRVPSGKKRLHNYGKSPFFMGKLTVNGHFQ